MEFEREFIVINNVPVINSDIQIRYYGIIIVVAMLVAAWVAARLAKRSKMDPDHIWGALTWAIIPAIILARLWFVFFPPISLIEEGFDTTWFLQNFFNLQNGAIAIWSGGLSIFGAVVGGLLGTYLYLRRNKLPFGPWLDIAGVCLPIGQAIGRWANFVNQELYGGVTDLPWGITIDAAHRVTPYKNVIDYPVTQTRFHPLFLYELLWSLIAFMVLLNIYQRYRNRLFPGDIFLIYILQYSFIRFLLEFVRVEITVLEGSNINVSQVFTGLTFLAAAVILVLRHRRRPQMQPSEQQEQPAA